MENASKALIIAGAILLSILLISLGIMVYNNTKDTVGNTNLNKQETETFNSEWLSYEGTGKTASEVKAMIVAVNASNNQENKNGKKRFINITTSGNPSASNALTAKPANDFSTSAVTNTQTYTVKLAYKDGLVVVIDYK